MLSKTSADEWKDRKHLGAQVSQANRETAETIARTITTEDQTFSMEQAKRVADVFTASVGAYEERTRKVVEKVKSSRAKGKMHVDQTIDSVTLTSMFQDSMDHVKQSSSASGSSSGHMAHMFTLKDGEESEEQICIDKPVSTKSSDKTKRHSEKYDRCVEYEPDYSPPGPQSPSVRSPAEEELPQEEPVQLLSLIHI